MEEYERLGMEAISPVLTRRVARATGRFTDPETQDEHDREMNRKLFGAVSGARMRELYGSLAAALHEKALDRMDLAQTERSVEVQFDRLREATILARAMDQMLRGVRAGTGV